MRRRDLLALAPLGVLAAPAPAKITQFRIRKFTLSKRDLLFLEVVTDTGVIGVGEGSLPGRVDIVEQAIRWLEPYFMGQDPAGVEDHWNRAYYTLSRWRDGSVMNTALAALDIALWDIEAQRLGVPIWRLLGGAQAKPLRVYYSHWSQDLEPRTPAALGDLARKTQAQGWTAVKWITFRGGTEWQRLERMVAEVKAVREAAGPDFDIALELAETFNVRTAIELGRALAPYRVMFLEEPTWRENSRALGDVAANSPIPIATGEGLVSRHEFRTLLEHHGARILQPDVIHCGGISELRRIAELGDVEGVEISPHMWYGPIAHCASLHAMNSCRNFLMQEWDAVHDRIFTELTYGTYPLPKGGRVLPPSSPGIGVRMDWAAWEKRCAYEGPSRRPPTGR